jgi:hypothetical protein
VVDAPPESLPLIDVARENTKQKDPLLGNHTIENVISYGGIVFRGRIAPNFMVPEDFNRDHDRKNSFWWSRVEYGRVFDKDGCFFKSDRSKELFGTLMDGRQDNDEDVGESLVPTNFGGNPGELFIWDTDATRIFPALLEKGAVLRVRWEFRELAEYAHVKVSKEIIWSWAASQKNDAGKFIQDNTIPGDNKVALEPINLTADLKDAKNPPDFTITSVDPSGLDKDSPNEVKVTIKLSEKINIENCKLFVYLTQEIPQDTLIGGGRTGETKTMINSYEITSTEIKDGVITGKLFTGLIKITGGDFRLKVLINGRAATGPKVFSVKKD